MHAGQAVALVKNSVEGLQFIEKFSRGFAVHRENASHLRRHNFMKPLYMLSLASHQLKRGSIPTESSVSADLVQCYLANVYRRGR